MYSELKQALNAGQLVGVATIIAGPQVGRKLLLWPDGRIVGSSGSATLDQHIQQLAQPIIRSLLPGRFTVEYEESGFDKLNRHDDSPPEEVPEFKTSQNHCDTLPPSSLPLLGEGAASPLVRPLVVRAGGTEGGRDSAQFGRFIFLELPEPVEEELADRQHVTVFVDVYPPRLKLIMVGAVHIAIPLTSFAKTLGFQTIIIDARAMFATPERFPHADQLIVQWPDEALTSMTIDEATYIVTLTHDEKLDNPALAVAVNSRARYIGALGARTTHAKRVTALKAQGISEEALARIHAPIGLNIGAVGPEEIAMSIMAEIVAVKRGMSG
ncbi:XdhC/CoxI family protein [Anaerolineales bacterium HSG25]|nr:XdhC/CoxI family protein [Anaerolineales bacterium HSG25]